MPNCQHLSPRGSLVATITAALATSFIVDPTPTLQGTVDSVPITRLPAASAVDNITRCRLLHNACFMALQSATTTTAARGIPASSRNCSDVKRVQLRSVYHRLAMAAVQGDVSAEAVVQRQLEAYNARDLEAFMDLLAEDCVATDAVTGAVLGTGKAELRKRYKARFQTNVHSELLGRLCLGSVVVDKEIITGLPERGVADCLATYHCRNGKIHKMEFVWQPRKQ